MKTCNRCGATKPLSEFHKDCHAPHGHRYSCKECDREHDARPEHIERRRQYGLSEQGKAGYRKYRSSEKGQDTYRSYRNSEARRRFVESGQRNAYHRQYEQQKLAHKRRLPATLTEEDWARCLDYFGHQCAYCGGTDPLAQDHFIPLSAGGAYTANNIVPACKPCNSRKKTTMPEQWCTNESYARVQSYFHSLTRSLTQSKLAI